MIWPSQLVGCKTWFYLFSITRRWVYLILAYTCDAKQIIEWIKGSDWFWAIFSMKAVNGNWLVGNVASGWWKIQYTVWKWWVACVTAICSLLSPNCKLYNKMWQSSIMPQGTNNFIIFFLTSLEIGKNTDFRILWPFYRVQIGPFLG